MHDFNTDHTQADNRLLIYKASAGSGKTYTLTQEYMRHLLKPGASVSRILAITFTNAATADMKRKILETLAQIAEGEYPTGKNCSTAIRGNNTSKVWSKPMPSRQNCKHRPD